MMNPFADLGMTDQSQMPQLGGMPAQHETGHRMAMQKPDIWKKKMAGMLGDVGQLFGNSMEPQSALMPQLQNYGVMEDPIRQPMLMPQINPKYGYGR